MDFRDRTPGLSSQCLPQQYEENPPLTPEFIATDALDFTLEVERLYASLMRFVAPAAEPSLGGRLLYAGELDAPARALLVAANIAGAASLAATADPVAQKQAVRDGVADFLVNSLDEALRILKNEIRKRETVAVCIAVAPEAIEREMQERGVVPDIVQPIKQGAEPEDNVLLAWSVATAPAHWLPKFDAIALDCLGKTGTSKIGAALRWLRLAPRYLGRLGQGLRVLRCGADAAKEFESRVREAVDHGEISVAVDIRLIP
jgi:urocanate hydratase